MMTTVERGLLEETTFVAFSSVGFMRLIWRKSDKPWQSSEHDVLGRRSLVTSRQLPSLIKRTTPLAHRGGGPSQCGSLVLRSYYRFLRIQSDKSISRRSLGRGS